jgi:branched-chain amino acid transport system ATP-binding protein
VAEALALRQVSAGYGDTVVLEDVNLALQAGESVSVIGRNGVGKTTLLATVMGHTTLHGGEVLLGGASLARVPIFRRARSGIGFVPQEREIFPSLSVRENLTVGARPGPWTQERVFDLFPNLCARLSHAGSQLSGGEQQMLSIARAMMLEPKVILLDEPTEGLMPRMVGQIHEIIRVLHGEGVAILLVEQNVPLTLEVSNRVYIMEKGVVRHHAPAAELRADHAVIHQYLGI